MELQQKSSAEEFANWNDLPDIHDVGHALDEKDQLCLEAIQKTLEKHGCLDRFGVTLLHKHFEMAEDEILVESVDEEARKLVTKPVKVDLVRGELDKAYETQWHFRKDENGQVAQICNARCFPGSPQSPQHVNKHVGY